MADVNSSLPVKTLTNGDVAVKVVDSTTTSQGLGVDASGRITTKMNDGSGNAVTSQVNGVQRALDVGIDVAGVQVDPRQVRALTSADIVTAAQGAPNTSTNAWPTKLTDGTNTATVKAASTAAVATDTAVVVSLSPNSPIPTGTNAIGSVLANLQVANAAVTALNPVPVTISAAVSGTVVNNYSTTAAVASSATSNHTYTITTGKSFQGKKIHASSSGRLKIEVQTSPDGTTFTSLFVAFNSTATPNIDIDMDEILFLQSVSTGAAIRVIRTNEEPLLAQDVYSTISGVEV